MNLANNPVSEAVALICLTYLAARGLADPGVAVAGLMACVLGHATAAGWRAARDKASANPSPPPPAPPTTGIGAAVLAVGICLGRAKARSLGLLASLALLAGCGSAAADNALVVVAICVALLWGFLTAKTRAAAAGCGRAGDPGPRPGLGARGGALPATRFDHKNILKPMDQEKS